MTFSLAFWLAPPATDDGGGDASLRTSRPALVRALVRDAAGDALSDAEIVARVQAGDHAAFSALFRAQYPALHRFVHAIVHTSDRADDVLQEVFGAIWANHARWTPALPIAGYLFRAARNRALERFRHDAVVLRTEREATQHGASPGMAEQSVTPDVAATMHDLEARLAQAIRALPERQRTAVLLRWHHGMNAAEIARVLGVSGPAVRKLLEKAEDTLRSVVGV